MHIIHPHIYIKKHRQIFVQKQSQPSILVELIITILITLPIFTRHQGFKYWCDGGAPHHPKCQVETGNHHECLDWMSLDIEWMGQDIYHPECCCAGRPILYKNQDSLIPLVFKTLLETLSIYLTSI